MWRGKVAARKNVPRRVFPFFSQDSMHALYQRAFFLERTYPKVPEIDRTLECTSIPFPPYRYPSFLLFPNSSPSFHLLLFRCVFERKNTRMNCHPPFKIFLIVESWKRRIEGDEKKKSGGNVVSAWKLL